MRQREILYGRYVLRSLHQEAGTWYARVRDLESGEVYKRSSGVPVASGGREKERSRRRARQAILDWLERFQAEEEDDLDVRDFAAAIDEWARLKILRESTRRDLEHSLALYKRAFGHLDVDEIDVGQVERFLHDLHERGRSPRTRQKHLAALRNFFAWSRRREYTDRDPTDGIKIRAQRIEKGVALTHLEARALLAACRSVVVEVGADHRREAHTQTRSRRHLQLAVLIALHTGLRRGNVLGLRWRHIDFGAARIDLPAEEMKGARPHVVPVHAELLRELRRELPRRQVKPDAYVLGEEYENLTAGFGAALGRAELPPMRWHDLRHTFATWMATRASFACLQALLAHSPGTVTFTYLHPPFDELRAAIDRLPPLLSDPQEIPLDSRGAL